MADKYISHDNYAGDAIEHGTGTSGDPYNLVQSGWDNIGAGDTCWLKIDGNYTYDNDDQPNTGGLDFDGVNNKIIKAYYSTIGDCDPGGPYYKDPTYGWAVLDFNGIAFDGITISGGEDYRYLANVKIIGVPAAQTSILYSLFAVVAAVFDNVWIVGSDSRDGIRIHEQAVAVVIHDCKFTGTYVAQGRGSSGFAVNLDALQGASILNCQFNHGNAVGSISSSTQASSSLDIIGNIFNLSGTVPDAIKSDGNCLIKSNTIYSSGTLTDGIDLTTAGSSVYNNIIEGATNPINAAAALYYQDYNCYTGNTETNGLTDDPRFADAPGGDFTPLYSKLQESGRGGEAIGAVSYKRRNSILVPTSVGSPITGAF